MASFSRNSASCMAVRASFRACSGNTARALEESEAAFAACSGLDSVRDILVWIRSAKLWVDPNKPVTQKINPHNYCEMPRPAETRSSSAVPAYILYNLFNFDVDSDQLRISVAGRPPCIAAVRASTDKRHQATVLVSLHSFHAASSLGAVQCAYSKRSSIKRRSYHTLAMEELLQKLSAFPPSTPLPDVEYDKQARSLVSLLHQGKLLGGGVELINVRIR